MSPFSPAYEESDVSDSSLLSNQEPSPLKYMYDPIEEERQEQERVKQQEASLEELRRVRKEANVDKKQGKISTFFPPSMTPTKEEHADNVDGK